MSIVNPRVKKYFWMSRSTGNTRVSHKRERLETGILFGDLQTLQML